MAKGTSNSQRGDGTLQSSDVSDQVVSQVGKAAVQILKLRQSLEENMATARTEEERETLTSQVETAAVRAIDEQGLTIDEYNEVIAAARSDPELEERVLVACKTA
jgi:conjugal transfer/entry exclusion protein